MCDFQELSLNWRCLERLFLPSLLHPIAWNRNTMADALAAVSNNEFEGHNLDTVGW